MSTKKAIIIGAGPAGLTAAYELLTSTNYIPIIIEADKQVGGISKTVDYNGNKIDIGGHRFFSKSEKVIDWWLKFLPLEQASNNSSIKIKYQQKEMVFDTENIANQTDNQNAVMLVRPRKSRILFNKKFFDYPLKLSLDTLLKLGIFRVVKITYSYIYARFFPIKDEKNLAQFFRNRFGNNLYQTFFKDYTEKVWGVKCEDIPADWGRQRVKDLNISKVILNSLKSIFKKDESLNQKNTSTSLIEQFLYPYYGPGQLWQVVADEIEKLGGTILLNTKVNEINFNHEAVIESLSIQLKEKGIEKIYGDVFFSTMPIKEFITQSKNIKIPTQIFNTASNLSYRDFLIVGLLIDKFAMTKIKKETTITDNWIYLQDKGIKAGRLQIFNNWSRGMVYDKNKIWIGVEFFCIETEAFWNQEDKKIIEQAISEMEHIGLILKQDVCDAVVVKVLKAYPSYDGAYKNFDSVKDYLKSINNLYCIGRNGMHKYNNSDHSMLTAMQSVHQLIYGGDKQIIWDINMEEDYHEEKN